MAANTNKKYLTISKEIGELRDGMGFKSKSIAGAKIFAKSAFNIGKFIVTELPPEIEKAKKREEQKRAKKNKL